MRGHARNLKPLIETLASYTVGSLEAFNSSNRRLLRQRLPCTYFLLGDPLCYLIDRCH